MENQTQPIQLPQPTQQPIESSPPKITNKPLPKWPLVVIGLVFIFILICGGAYFLNQKLLLKIQVINNTLNKSTLAVTPDPTAAWKTYTMPKTIQFKFPADWSISPIYKDSKIDQIGITSPKFTFEGKTMTFTIILSEIIPPITEPSDGYFFSIEPIYMPSIGKHLSLVVDGTEPGSLRSYPTGAASMVEITDHNVKLGRTEENADFKTNNSNVIVSIYGQFLSKELDQQNELAETLQYLDPAVFKSSAQYKIFKQIAESIKFTDQASQSPVPFKIEDSTIPGWKKYEDNLKLFSIDFPSTIYPNQCGGGGTQSFNPTSICDYGSERKWLISILNDKYSNLNDYLDKDSYNINESNININNHSYKQYSLVKKTTLPIPASKIITYFPHKPNNFFIIYTLDVQPNFNEEYNKMLTTFKFTP